MPTLLRWYILIAGGLVHFHHSRCQHRFVQLMGRRRCGGRFEVVLFTVGKLVRWSAYHWWGVANLCFYRWRVNPLAATSCLMGDIVRSVIRRFGGLKSIRPIPTTEYWLDLSRSRVTTGDQSVGALKATSWFNRSRSKQYLVLCNDDKTEWVKTCKP